MYKISNYTVGEASNILERFENGLQVVINKDGEALDITSVKLQSFDPETGEVFEDVNVGSVLCVSVNVEKFGELV